MANPVFRGNAVIYGAAGALTFNATAITSLNQSGSSTNADETVEFKGSQGKLATVINVEDIYDLEFELIPSHATTVATAAGYAGMVRKNDKLVTTGFLVADYNATSRITDFSTHITNTGALTLRIKSRKNEADFSAAAVAA